jgi:hypothetical protein
MNYFVTIITPDYLHYALSLRHSILDYYSDFNFVIYFTNENNDQKYYIESKFPNTLVLSPSDLTSICIEKDLRNKYSVGDKYRWSMKPVVMKYLFLFHNATKVIYCDCDIQFFSNSLFLFNLLNTYNIVLSPHFRSSNPIIDYDNYIMQFNDGIYNGGFVAANKNGIPALDLWARNCLAICEINSAKGQYVDQSHLNILPIFFDNVYSLKHRGCNIANWNQDECKRIMLNDGSVLINNEFPVVFIHFTKSTINGLFIGQDGLLFPFLKQ